MLLSKASAAVVAAAFIAAAAGCARGAAHEARAPGRGGFSTEEQRILACLDLQDHIVDLFTSAYVSRQGVKLSSDERSAFRDGWAEQLAKDGTFDGFEQACFGSVTPRRYDCGMSSRSTGGVADCMRMSAR